MTPNLKIFKNVISRLSNIKSKCFGCLYGIIYDNCILVLGFVSENTDDSTSVLYSFPAEVDFCGIIGIGEVEFNSPQVKKLLQDVDVTDNPLFLSCKIGDGTDIIANFIVHGKPEVANFELLTEADMTSQFINVRLQTRIPFTCNFQKDLVREASTALRKQLASGQVAFHFPKTSVYLMGSDSESGLTGLAGDPEVGELYSYSDNIDDTILNSKVKKKAAAKEMNFLNVEMFRKATKDDNDDGNKFHAPVIDFNKRIYECLSVWIKIDALAMVHTTTKVVHLYEILIECLCRNLRLMERCLLAQLDAGKDEPDATAVSLPEPFHFFHRDCGHFITRFYARDVPEADYEAERRHMHEAFMLSLRWPAFRRMNAFAFKDRSAAGALPLANPHEHLATVAGPGVATVRGSYLYFHYMQGGVDDDGWGCAYRSLQTLFSWFRLQGYTSRPVPSHRDIQQCLVSIKDKPQSFLGSRQWIGSTEVSFCLDVMLGVSCRILYCASGQELADKGPELVAHFQTQGTPIMVGGGQLAHTIIGVDYRQDTGDVRFLVLDPHYPGAEDLHTVTSKGWCGWKSASFWHKASYYNLCLPQVPACI